MPNVDTPAPCGLLLARLKLAQGDTGGADVRLAEVNQYVLQHDFGHLVPEVVAAQVRSLLQQGSLAAAAHLANVHELPASRARVHLAQGNASAALTILAPWRQQTEAAGRPDDRLEAMVLETVLLDAQGETDRAVDLLAEVLALAEPGGFVRIFLDEGPAMARLLYEAATRGVAPVYARRLLSAFPVAGPVQPGIPVVQDGDFELVEPLSAREVEVLKLVSDGLSNREIAARLYLSLNTVKSHTRNAFGKLGVRSRTQAVARARSLGILPFG
jgi:LuxR family maltose regulon positive regulatory protein